MVYLYTFDGLFWWILGLTALWFMQRVLHREIQIIFLILSRNASFTMGAFAFIFLPGVFLHELSHYLMARILGVRTGRFSLIPRPLPNGKLLLGYVETVRSDYLRDSLVGAAPMIVGSLVVAYLSVYQLKLVVLWDTFRNGQMDLFFMGLGMLPSVPYFWLWLWLAFVISSSMMPSESDRFAWLPLAMVLGVVVALALLAGVGPLMLEYLAPPLNDFLRGSALILLVSVVVHIVFFLPLLLIHRLLSKVTGLDVY